MKRLCGFLFMLMTSATMSQTLTEGEKKAHAIAKDALPKILAAKLNLSQALEQQNMKVFETRFERPLMKMEETWNPHSYRALGITDQDMIMVSVCGLAVTDLLQYGQALVREGNHKWADYSLKRFNESIADCKKVVLKPEPYRE